MKPGGFSSVDARVVFYREISLGGDCEKDINSMAAKGESRDRRRT